MIKIAQDEEKDNQDKEEDRRFMPKRLGFTYISHGQTCAAIAIITIYNYN